jgi:hypothetical protein
MVTWSEPSVNSYCVSSYYIEWKENSDNSSSTGNGTTTVTYDIQDLEACIEYEVSVVAMNLETERSRPVNKTSRTNTDGKGESERLIVDVCCC